MPVNYGISARLSPIITSSGNFPGSFQTLMEQALTLSDGVGADQADRFFYGERTVASGANDDLDLAAGNLLDPFGAVLTFAKVKTLLIINAPRIGAPNTTNLTIGGGTNPVTGLLGGTTPTLGPMKPGEVLLRHASVLAGLCSVTAATADILRIANSAGAPATYQIAIIGTSA
jgi:hypothetical protein